MGRKEREIEGKEREMKEERKMRDLAPVFIFLIDLGMLERRGAMLECG